LLVGINRERSGAKSSSISSIEDMIRTAKRTGGFLYVSLRFLQNNFDSSSQLSKSVVGLECFQLSISFGIQVNFYEDDILQGKPVKSLG
jgi:hypothetical protein